MNEAFKYFINAHEDQQGNICDGHIMYCGKYIKSNQEQWVTVECEEYDEFAVIVDYKFCIKLENNRRQVFDTEKKIETTAHQLGKSLNDIHLNSDGTCCLGLNIRDEELTSEQFVINKILPFFFWQAYLAKFKKTPPCGELPHNFTHAKQEIRKDYKSLNRNSICICGSGKKYKKCCINKQL